MKIVVISDTHGLLRDSLVKLVESSDLVIHAGDMDDAGTFSGLMDIGVPVRAARGNCDHGAWAERIPPFELFDFAGYTFYVRHIPWMIDIEPSAAGVDVVVTGHTHKVDDRMDGGVRFINPGSAGPASGKAATAMLLKADSSGMDVEVIRL